MKKYLCAIALLVCLATTAVAPVRVQFSSAQQQPGHSFDDSLPGWTTYTSNIRNQKSGSPHWTILATSS